MSKEGSLQHEVHAAEIRATGRRFCTTCQQRSDATKFRRLRPGRWLCAPCWWRMELRAAEREVA